MSQVPFEVNSFDSNEQSVFNSLVTFDQGIIANSVTANTFVLGGTNIAQVFVNASTPQALFNKTLMGDTTIYNPTLYLTTGENIVSDSMTFMGMVNYHTSFTVYPTPDWASQVSSNPSNPTYVEITGVRGPDSAINGTRWLFKTDDNTYFLKDLITNTGSPYNNISSQLPGIAIFLNAVPAFIAPSEISLPNKEEILQNKTIVDPVIVGYSVALNLNGSNTMGGIGYMDFLKATNLSPSATNINKTLRLGPTGALEILNSAYTTTLLTLEDDGDLFTAGKINGAAVHDTGWVSVNSFSNGFSGTSVAYRRINNVVYLRGRITGGTAGSGAFLLPTGYRPTTIDFVLPAQQYGTGNITYVTVQNSDGNVIPNTSSAWLSGISFPVG